MKKIALAVYQKNIRKISSIVFESNEKCKEITIDDDDNFTYIILYSEIFNKLIECEDIYEDTFSAGLFMGKLYISGYTDSNLFYFYFDFKLIFENIIESRQIGKLEIVNSDDLSLTVQKEENRIMLGIDGYYLHGEIDISEETRDEILSEHTYIYTNGEGSREFATSDLSIQIDPIGDEFKFVFLDFEKVYMKMILPLDRVRNVLKKI